MPVLVRIERSFAPGIKKSGENNLFDTERIGFWKKEIVNVSGFARKSYGRTQIGKRTLIKTRTNKNLELD